MGHRYKDLASGRLLATATITESCYGGIKMPNPLFVRAEWDAEAGVCVATSDDVPGLATESTTIEALIEKLRVMIPELLSANGMPGDEAIMTGESSRSSRPLLQGRPSP